MYRAEGNGGRRTVAKGIATTGDAEVCFCVSWSWRGGARGRRGTVHFVIHDDTGFGNHDSAAKDQVDGRRQAQCKP